MARAIRWRFTFESTEKEDYTVNIYSEGWTGSVTELTPATNPIEWQEDDSDDLLSVVRYKTGYISVVEETFGALDNLKPTSATSNYVECYRGSTLAFTGYMQEQTFENSYCAAPRTLLFPIVSPLGLLEEMNFSDMTPQQITIGQLLQQVITRLNAGYTHVVAPNWNMTANLSGKLYSTAVCPYNADYQHTAAYNIPEEIFKPCTYLYFVEGVCNAYGWMVHDTPTEIVFSRHDYVGNSVRIAIADLPASADYTTITPATVSLTDYYTYKDNSATESTIRPLKQITKNYDGEYDYMHMDLTRTSYQSAAFGVWSLIFLKSESGELSGGKMLDTNTADLYYKLTNSGINIVALHSPNNTTEEGLLMKYDTSWQANAKLFEIELWQRSYGLTSLVLDTIFVYLKWGSDFMSLGTEARSNSITLGVSIMLGDGMYYDSNYNSWVSTEQIYDITFDSNGAGYVSTAATLDTWQKPITLKFYNRPNSGIDNEEHIFIYNINGGGRNESWEKEYTANTNESNVITGNILAKEEATIDMHFTQEKSTNHHIGDNHSYDFVFYDYMFEVQKTIQAKFSRTATLVNPYTNIISYNGTDWRIIAISESPADDDVTIYLHNKPTSIS